jgi:hypothetical protein
MLIGPKERARRNAEEPDEKPARGRLPRFGVVLFDESRDSGWACLYGQEPFRFRQPQDLPNDCIWVCSLGQGEFRQRWGTMHHLRSADYVSKLHHLAADYGLRVDGEGKFGQLAQKAASQLAPTIHRSLVIASQVYNWNDPASMLRKDSLSEDIRECLISPPPVKNHMRGPLAAAYQSYSSPSWGNFMGQKDSITLTLRYNRLDYARKLMSIQVPDGAWTKFGDEGDRKGRLQLEDFLNPDRPCIVNATVDFGSKDPEIAALCAYGSQPSSRGPLRAWISQPELLWLTEYATVHVTAAYVAPCGKPLPHNVQLPELLLSDPLFTLSIPAGLVAEAHWKAIGTPVYNPRSSSADKKDYSVWSVWLRAWDRAHSFDLALKAHRADFYVTGYGNGAIVVRCPRDRLPALLDFCQDNEINHPAFQSIFAEHGLLPD